MWKKSIVLACCFLMITRASLANEWCSYLQGMTSPLCTNAKYILGTGALLTLGIRFGLSEDVRSDFQKRTLQKDHLKDWGKVGGDVGYGYLNASYVLYQFVFGGRQGNARALHMFEASTYTFGLTQALKKSIHESRPGFPEDPESFPSGHASFSFAFASVVTAQHGWLWGGAAHVLASFIAFSRINDNWHQLHDVVAGMTIGMSYGWGLYLSPETYRRASSQTSSLMLLPTPNFDGMALGYVGRF